MKKKTIVAEPVPEVPLVTLNINKICHRAIPTTFACVRADCALWSEEHEACADLLNAESRAAMIESADGVVKALDALRQPFSIVAYLLESSAKKPQI